MDDGGIGGDTRNDDMEILKKILLHAAQCHSAREGGGAGGGGGGGDGVDFGAHDIKRKPLNIPLVQVLKSYEIVLKHEHLVPSEGVCVCVRAEKNVCVCVCVCVCE
jgi:hypothetical protein